MRGVHITMKAITAPKKRPRRSTIWFRFKKNRLALFGLVVIIVLVAMTIGVSVFGDYSNAIDLNPADRFQSPSAEHWFGTDHQGRDVFWRVLFGARVSLLLGVAIVFCIVVLGIIMGSIAGYFGGKVDSVIMRVVDIFLSIPAIILAIAIVAALGSSIFNLLIALTLANWPATSRIMRASIMKEKGQEYVEAAHCAGASNFRIILTHMIPNSMAPMLVEATLALGRSILGIATMSFLGLGVSPPTPEWGYMISEAMQSIRYFPFIVLIPGAFMALTVMAFNLTGDGLRDALDPKLKN